MNKTNRKSNRIWLLASALILIASVGGADSVTQAQARKVALTFAANDSSLKACSVYQVNKRENMWIVSFKPQGYVAVSANDSADPIALFSATDFVEPSPDSQFASILCTLNEDIASATGDAYRSKWNKLLTSKRTLQSALVVKNSVTASDETEVKVNVPSAWQQCQPFNDFMPIEYASGNSINSCYRGRRFLGCVPTAYVQIMNYWQWPEVIDNDTSEQLNIPAEKYEGVNPISSYTPRIKSGTNMEWEQTQSQYPNEVCDSSGVSSGVYDLRGTFSEKKRLCIGRACLLSQIISKASLKTTGTGATLAQPAYNDWYETPVGIGHGSSGGTDGTDPDWFFGEVRKSLEAGIPMLVGIDVKDNDGWIGHAVVGTGWKYENDTHFFELNYGWGGGSAYHSYDSIKAHLGSIIPYQRPKPKPIIVNQPEISALPFSLNWHFPKKGWDKELTGFKIIASEYGATLEDEIDTFDTNPGVASGENSTTIFTGTYEGANNETAILVVKPDGKYGTKTYYTWNKPKTLSADSSLSFRLRANDTRGISVILQTNVDGAGWQDAYTFERYDEAVADWHKVTLPLTGLAECSIRFRLYVEKIASVNAQWKDSDPVGYMIDDFTVTQVEAIGAVNPFEVASVTDPSARSVTITEGLNIGTKYALKVQPVFSEGLAIDSEYISIQITDKTLEAPQFVTINSVPKHGSAPQVLENCFRECALGQNYLYIQGSKQLTSLKAYSSHISILPDSKITVQSIPNQIGCFLVSIDGSEIPALNGRQRIILTLIGSNDFGAKIQKDLTLRFSSQTTSEAEVLITDFDDDEPEDDEPVVDPDTRVDPDEPTEESPVVTPTFPKADDAGPNDDIVAKTRFCPGVSKTSGWYDVARLNTYGGYIPPAAQNLVKWWVKRWVTAKGSDPKGYTVTADTTLPTSDTGLTLVGYLNTLLSGCTVASSYFPDTVIEASTWSSSASDSKTVAVGRKIYAALANGPVGFCVKNTKDYYCVIWGCDYATDTTGNYATKIYFTGTKSKNDNTLESSTISIGDMYNTSDTGDLMLPSYSSNMNAIFDFFYPISAPQQEASGDGEVTVKVQADGKEFDISKAFSKVTKDTSGTVVYTLDATPGKKIQIGEEQISIQPELAESDDEPSFEIQEGKLVFKVKSIPGLKYQVLASDTLDPNSFTPAGKEREATTTRRELTVNLSSETRGFYKKRVSR